MSESPWPDAELRRALIVDFCRGRALAVPVISHEDWIMVRYRTKHRAIFIDSPSEYDDVKFYIQWRFSARARGMYATNAVFKERKNTPKELFDMRNVTAYMGMVDIDNVRGNEELGFAVARDILSKLVHADPWLVVSGSGIHINVNGFRSWMHAKSFFTAMGVLDDRTQAVEVHLLNDKGRIGTVPWETYKKDDNVLCYAFMPEDVDDVFSDPATWREFHPGSCLDPWNRLPTELVQAWNELDFVDVAAAVGREPQTRCMSDMLDLAFWAALPPCVHAAFFMPRDDCRLRILSFLTSFMAKVGIPAADIREVVIARAMMFTAPLDPDEAERVVDDVLAAGLRPPGCGKLRWKGGDSFPYLNMAEAKLCPYGKDQTQRCETNGPWREYCLNRRESLRTRKKQ